MEVKVINNLGELVTYGTRDEIALFISDYNTWIIKQLLNGGLIFSPEDYFGIWRGV